MVKNLTGPGYGLSVRKSMCAKIARVAFSLIRILEILLLSYGMRSADRVLTQILQRSIGHVMYDENIEI